MKSGHWYIHFDGESKGPLDREKVLAMLKQNRIQFGDFAWREGLTKWVRIFDLDDFASALPPYPSQGLPQKQESLAVKEEKREAQAETKEVNKASPKVEVKAPANRAAEEERRYLRIPLKGHVEVEGWGELEVVNIAERGIFVKSQKLPESGLELDFTLNSELSEKALEMHGVVVRHVNEGSQKGFAIEFVRLNPSHKRLIESYLEKHGLGEG